MSAPDSDPNTSPSLNPEPHSDPALDPKPGRNAQARPARQKLGSGKSMNMVLGAAVTVLFVASAFAVAVFAGVIDFGRSGAPAQSSPVTVQPQPQPGNTRATAAAPTSPAAPVQRANVVQQTAFGDWIYRCVEAPGDGQVRCAIAQHLSDAESKEMIFLWRILQDGEGGLIGVWQTPEAVLLHAGISLVAGTEEPIVIPYETCRRGRCQATVNLASDFVDRLAQAENAKATIVARGGQPVNLTLSVVGLADALTALRGPNPVANPNPPQ